MARNKCNCYMKIADHKRLFQSTYYLLRSVTLQQCLYVQRYGYVYIMPTKTSQVCSIYSVWYICNNSCQRDDIGCIIPSMSSSLQNITLIWYTLIADANLRAWHRQVKYMVQPNSLCVIDVLTNVLVTDTQGKFIRGTGSFMHYYVCRGIFTKYIWE